MFFLLFFSVLFWACNNLEHFGAVFCRPEWGSDRENGSGECGPQAETPNTSHSWIYVMPLIGCCADVELGEPPLHQAQSQSHSHSPILGTSFGPALPKATILPSSISWKIEFFPSLRCCCFFFFCSLCRLKNTSGSILCWLESLGYPGFRRAAIKTKFFCPPPPSSGILRWQLKTNFARLH